MGAQGNALLGFALDVSGSMRTSIGDSRQQSRLSELRRSLERVIEQTRTRPVVAPPSPGELRIFVYVFGTKIPGYNVLDVLSVLQAQTSLPQVAPPGRDENGFRSLSKLASEYDCKDWAVWAVHFITEKEAKILADELFRDRESARELASLLPRGLGAAAIDAGVAVFSKVSGSGHESRLERAKKIALKLISRGQGVTPEQAQLRLIAERISKAPARAVLLSEIPGIWDKARAGTDLDQAEQYLFGDTPLCGVLSAARDRFIREQNRSSPTQRLLFLLSDGEPTDGDPAPIAEKLRSEGVTIASCFVTDRDIGRPRVLYSVPQGNWDKGAKLMFDMASPVPEDSAFGQYLANHGWEIGLGAKMFVQVNHSEILDDVILALLRLIEGPDRSLYSELNKEG